MKRWVDDYFVTLRQWRRRQEMRVSWEANKDPYDVDYQGDEQKGRFRKRDAHDCGRPRCMLCHCYKVPKRQSTLLEKKATVSFWEQLREM